MPKCHQCNSDNTTNGRTGDCGICLAKNVQFCQECAMWELGPMDSDKTPLEDMKDVEKEITVSRQESESGGDKVSSVAQLPIGPEVFLDMCKEVCPFIKEQLENDKATLYGQQFKEYATKAITKFQNLYPSCKYDRQALQVLIVFHLSSQERVQCRDKQDRNGESTSAAAKYVKRWQTRTIAKQHISHHFDKIETQFGKTVKDLVSKKTWLDALGLDEIEYFLKQFYPPTLMAKRLLEIADKPADAKETLEIATILYHVIAGTRTKTQVGAHWSLDKKVSRFKPGEALGYLTKERYEFLFGAVDEASDFSDSKDALSLINNVWTALEDDRPGNILPDHPRFSDGRIAAGLPLEANQFLQYLPTFDLPQSKQGDRTDCEKIVRKRVKDTLKPYRDRWLKATYHDKEPILSFFYVDNKGTQKNTKTVELTSGDITGSISFKKPSVGNIPSSINTARQNAINTFVDQVLGEDHLKKMLGQIVIKVANEMGNKRRESRRENVVAAIQERFDANKEKKSLHPLVKGDGGIEAWDVDEYLDKLIATMRDNFEVDLAFGKDAAKSLIKTDEYVPKGWFPFTLEDKPYSVVFPSCKFNEKGPQLSTIDKHYEEVIGSSPRPAHYMDWRAHKDLWLYDCFNIPPMKRPLFCSLSVQPVLPEVNSNYGDYGILFKRENVKNRCIHNLGDKQQPRRSMLLLLDDILYEHTKKDGDPGQSHTDRRQVADDILARMEMFEVCGDMTLEEQWSFVINRDRVPYPGSDLLIECQIFGDIDLKVQAKAAIINEQVVELVLNSKVDESVKHIKDTYNLESLLFNQTIKSRKAYEHPTPEDREDLLNKRANEHTAIS